MTFQFNHQKKVGANVKLLTGKTEALLSYGIRIDKTQLALVTLVNIKHATTGCEYRPAMQNICRKYKYN
jgi:hypothetical protein